MKQRLKFALIAIFPALWFVTMAPSSVVTAIASSGATSPQSLYVQNCARCHGSDGHASTPLGRKLEAADLTVSDVKAKSVASISPAIKNGRPDMPAFGKKLTPAQISAIAGYVRGL